MDIYNLYVDVVTIVLLQCIYCDTPAIAAGLKKQTNES